MAVPFKCIGKRINDFLKAKEYELDRTAKINVKSEKVDWTLENKLNKEGAIESELNVSHGFDSERLSLNTSTTKAPQFEINSNRFQPNFNLKGIIQDPKLEFKLCQKREKYALCIDSSYDWSSHNCDADVAVTYGGIENLVLGTKVKVERSQREQTLGITDYNVGAQFTRNKDQTFALTTEDQLQKVKVGAEFKVRDSYKGYAQVSYNTAEAESPLNYSVGVSRNIDSDSSIRGVFRNDQTASVLYMNRFADSNVCTKVAANFNFTKPASQRANLQWKIVFGSSCGTKQCCKNKK